MSENNTTNEKDTVSNGSILTSIKLFLGITEEYEHYDPQIIMHINTAFMLLSQLGVGPIEGFTITDKSSVWSEYIQVEDNLEAVKSYIGYKVRLMFDPPSSSAITESINRVISELEWRLNVEAEAKNTQSQ